jgi:hypothetical protein
MARPKKGEQKKPADQALMDKIKRILKAHFKDDGYVDVAPGYGENIHVVVMSRKFDGMLESIKMDYLWDLIDKSELSEEEKLRISMIMPLSPDDVR